MIVIDLEIFRLIPRVCNFDPFGAWFCGSKVKISADFGDLAISQGLFFQFLKFSPGINLNELINDWEGYIKLIILTCIEHHFSVKKSDLDFSQILTS